MDKSLKKFISVSFIFITLLVLMFVALEAIYHNFTVYVYKYLDLGLMLLLALSILFVLLVFSQIIVVYSRKSAKFLPKWLKKAGLRFLLPAAISIAGLFKLDKDSVRTFFINYNNILVEAGINKYSPDEILVLLPRCMQRADCGERLYDGLNNCKKCFKCSIGKIKEVVEEFDVNSVIVATGGTVARETIERLKPAIVLAVACERELVSGISDVRNVSTYGIINMRPNGPCFNTSLDIDVFKRQLEGLVKENN
ncbi:MAG: DUF116 domain-containing protein [Bacillota bacterium]|nr:DUF116 domain-containing protein [Bacillota bacterium]